MRPLYGGRIWASQGGLSRNKVAVGESAAGSPPQTETTPTGWLTTCGPVRLAPIMGRPGTFELPRLTPYLRSPPRVESGPIAQWESASFARRMPRVRIPVGPYSGWIESCPLSGAGDCDLIRTNQCTSPRKCGWEGLMQASRLLACR